MKKHDIRKRLLPWMKGRKPLRIVAAGAIALLATGVAVDAMTSPAPRADLIPIAAGAAFKPIDADDPVLRIDRDEVELGRMSVHEERSADFTIANLGGVPLEISNVRTSCMCTFAAIAADSEKSPEFNMDMHNPASVRNWKTVLEPEETATVTLVYRPALMPVQGSIARTVNFNTNDPQRPVAELGVHATVP